MMPDSLLAGLDLSSIPDAPKPKSLLEGLDLSSIPDAPKPQLPFVGEDAGSQPSSYNPDAWINDEIPAAPAQPIIAGFPTRPASRLYRENALALISYLQRRRESRQGSSGLTCDGSLLHWDCQGRLSRSYQTKWERSKIYPLA